MPMMTTQNQTMIEQIQQSLIIVLKFMYKYATKYFMIAKIVSLQLSESETGSYYK